MIWVLAYIASCIGSAIILIGGILVIGTLSGNSPANILKNITFGSWVLIFLVIFIPLLNTALILLAIIGIIKNIFDR